MVRYIIIKKFLIFTKSFITRYYYLFGISFILFQITLTIVNNNNNYTNTIKINKIIKDESFIQIQIVVK